MSHVLFALETPPWCFQDPHSWIFVLTWRYRACKYQQCWAGMITEKESKKKSPWCLQLEKHKALTFSSFDRCISWSFIFITTAIQMRSPWTLQMSTQSTVMLNVDSALLFYAGCPKNAVTVRRRGQKNSLHMDCRSSWSARPQTQATIKQGKNKRFFFTATDDGNN